MSKEKPYIKIEEDDDHEPTAAELLLDTDTEIEYTTPYTDSDDFTDLFGNCEQFGIGGIFDDR